jgi:hypothetical protein
MATKFRIKLGALEVDYEGSVEFSMADLMALLKELHAIRSEIPEDDETTDDGDSGDDEKKTTIDAGSLSTSDVAQKLGADSGPDLVMAAAAKLIICDKKETATRKELLLAMQSASAYYKTTYSKNLGATLKRLVLDSKLNEVGANTYGLHVDARKELVKKLAKPV